MNKNENSLEALILQYQLRSSFFLRKLEEFLRLKKELPLTLSQKIKWKTLQELGISLLAWERINNQKIEPHLVFCHPEIICDKPKLIAYYRLLSGFPQKGVQRLAFGVQELEKKSKASLEPERAIILARLFNQQISSLLEQNPRLSLTDLHFLSAMNFGAQVNGSWRNEIGKEGNRRVKELLLDFFKEKIKDIELIDGKKIALEENAMLSIDEIRKIKLENGYQLIFASEPDISILDPSGKLEGAIEIKAGLDPAGALERYGAAKKSFDKALEENKSVTTIYLASCLTEEVKNRIKSDRLVRKEFDLTKILTDPKTRKDFLDYIKWLVRL